MSVLADEYYNLKYNGSLCESKAFECPDSLKEILSGMSNKDIMKADGLDQYARFYLLCLKYKRNIINEAVLKQNKMVFKGAALSFGNPHFMKITSFDSEKDRIIIKGFIFSSVLGVEFSLFAKDESGNAFRPETKRYNQKDVTGLAGEPASTGQLFEFRLPAGEYRFFIAIHGGASNGDIVRLDPSFEESTGMTRDIENSCANPGDFVVVYSDKKLSVRYEGENSASAFDQAVDKFREAVNGQEVKPEIRQKWQNDLKIRDMVKRAALKDRVCFITTRSDGVLHENPKYLYGLVKSDKVFFAKTHLKQDLDASLKAAELVYTSKVVVTDDYLYLLRNYGKAAGQKVVQLWHATGSFKKFGQDGSEFFPDVDARYHKDYDCVTVSSEQIKDVYAHAFNIDVSKVVAAGAAKTDALFDKELGDRLTRSIYEKYPVLRGKTLLLYAPTFRSLQGRDRSVFVPELDFDELSKALGGEQITVICPHPVMTEPVLHKKYDNIIEVRDFNTSEMMYAADVLITDYSSVVFEFSLLNKPVLFFCYDFDDYDRDFYLDYDHDLPGDVLKSQDELLRIIKKGKYEVDGRMAEFRDKNMGACDGHCSERIAGMIDKMVKSE